MSEARPGTPTPASSTPAARAPTVSEASEAIPADRSAGTDADASAARAFVLKLGEGLHRYGYAAHRLEDALTLVSRRLGLEGHFFSTPTSLLAGFGPPHDQRASLIRIEPGAMHLDKLARLDEAAERVARGELTPEQGGRRLREIEAEPAPYGPRLTTLAYALSAGAAARFLGGGGREVAAATVSGLGIGVLALLALRAPRVGRVFEPLAAALAACLAAAAGAQLGPLSVTIATLAGLIVLLPGFSLTVAMIELATRNLVSGTARLAGALGVFVSLGLGVALGSRVGELLAGPAPAVAPAPLPAWSLGLALLVAPLGFTVLLRAEPRDMPAVVAAGLVAFAGARGGALVLGAELGAFAGAFAVAAASNTYSWWLRRPSVIPLVPGLLLLVPGSLGFASFQSLLARETLVGIESAFRMALVAVALATGLLMGGVLLPPRPFLGGAQRKGGPGAAGQLQ